MADDEQNVKNGAFIVSLKRNNREIRNDRAEAIYDDASMIYKRYVEDIEQDIKKMKREQENMLDLSPENAMTLKLATDFNADAYVEKDVELGIKIRNAEIKLDIAKKRFEYLFGGN